MNADYTPGPWTDKSIDGSSWGVYAPNGDQVAQAQQIRTFKTDPFQQERSANARLIAAAPELLEALQGLEPLLDQLICYASTTEEHKPNALVQKAIAAIAKATGEAS